jgi:hypothetical protein
MAMHNSHPPPTPKKKKRKEKKEKEKKTQTVSVFVCVAGCVALSVISRQKVRLSDRCFLPRPASQFVSISRRPTQVSSAASS